MSFFSRVMLALAFITVRRCAFASVAVKATTNIAITVVRILVLYVIVFIAFVFIWFNKSGPVDEEKTNTVPKMQTKKFNANHGIKKPAF